MDLLQNFVYSFGLNYNKLDQNNFTHNNPQIDALRNNKLASYAPEDKIVTQNIGIQRSHLLEDSTRLNDYYSNNVSRDMSTLKANSDKKSFINIPHGIDNKRMRNMFTLNQIEILEKVFESTHYPDSSIREHLSSRLNLSVLRIQVWFQNRRAKFRKIDAQKQSKKAISRQTTQNDSESSKNDVQKPKSASVTPNIDLQHPSQLGKTPYSSAFNDVRNQQNASSVLPYHFDANQALPFASTNYSRLLQENPAFNFATNNYNMPINFKKLSQDLNNLENNYMQELNLIDRFQQYEQSQSNHMYTSTPVNQQSYYV